MIASPSPYKSDGKIVSERNVESVSESPSIKSESDGSPMRALVYKIELINRMKLMKEVRCNNLLS